jgi:hypothetical protein
MTNKKVKRIVETPFSSKNLRNLEKTGITIGELAKLPKIQGRTYADKIKLRKLN